MGLFVVFNPKITTNMDIIPVYSSKLSCNCLYCLDDWVPAPFPDTPWFQLLGGHWVLTNFLFFLLQPLYLFIFFFFGAFNFLRTGLLPRVKYLGLQSGCVLLFIPKVC